MITVLVYVHMAYKEGIINNKVHCFALNRYFVYDDLILAIVQWVWVPVSLLKIDRERWVGFS
jgi:hypothetical protein